jgi:hypothetical protein
MVEQVLDVRQSMRSESMTAEMAKSNGDVAAGESRGLHENQMKKKIFKSGARTFQTRHLPF